MGLFVKAGVLPKNLVIAAAVANTAQALEISATITSGTDGKHKQGSKHYTAEALDVRTKDMKPAMKHLFAQHLKDRLGANYDVILESLGKTNEHLHVEYDPK